MAHPAQFGPKQRLRVICLKKKSLYLANLSHQSSEQNVWKTRLMIKIMCKLIFFCIKHILFTSVHIHFEVYFYSFFQGKKV